MSFLLIRNCISLHLLNYTCIRCHLYAGLSTSYHYAAGQFWKKSDFELVASITHVGNVENEVLNSLMSNEQCCLISLSHTLVHSLLRRFKDDWKSALGIFRWAELHPCLNHRPETCDLMVDVLGKARQFDKMRGLVGELCDKKLVTLKTVAKIMRRFSGARQWKDAVKAFDELGTFGLQKNTESMNLLLDTLCKENQIEMAREVFFGLKSHIPPSACTFNIFIHGWCKIKRVEEAHWTRVTFYYLKCSSYCESVECIVNCVIDCNANGIFL